MKKLHIRPVYITFAIIAIIAAAAIAAAYFFFTKYQTSQKLLENPTEAAKVEIKTLTQKVGALIDLPRDEEPTVATVLDKDKLKNQPFFAKSQNGDKVLIYTKAQQAILYRPSINKVMAVAPINIGQNTQGETAGTQTAAANIKVVIYNGTTTAGLTNILEEKLKEKITNIDIVDKTNAGQRNYDKTLVIDLSGSKTNEAQQLASLLEAEVSSLPQSEKAPQGADILIIAGNDYAAKNTPPTPTPQPTETVSPTP